MHFRQQLDAEIQKGFEDLDAGKVVSSKQVRAEMQSQYGVWFGKLTMPKLQGKICVISSFKAWMKQFCVKKWPEAVTFMPQNCTGIKLNDYILDYISNVLLEPLVAARQVTRIMDAVDSLENMPMRHKLHDNEPWRSRGLRIIPVDN